MASSTSKPSANDTHIRKRPFQPSITSYFHNSPNGSLSQSTRPQSPLSPPLPAETQASLLSVGMRVRKSVPEGYKTHKTIGTAGFPFPSTAPTSQPLREVRQAYASGGGRELTPFCGLHKTGGWAAQEVPSSSAPAVMTMEEDGGDVPGLSFSQRNFASSRGAFGLSSSRENGSRKRTYEEEAEDEIDAFFDEAEAEAEAEEAMEQRMARDDRPIARVKGMKGKTGGHQPVRVVGEDDFEEASFLAPMEVDGV